LEVIQVSVPLDGAKAPVEEFRLRLPAGHMQELRTMWTIDGPYDRARFLFYVVPQESARIPSLLILTKEPSAEKAVERTAKVQEAIAAEAVVGPDAIFGPPVPPTLLDLEIVWGARRYFGKRILPGVSLVVGLFLFFGADWVASLWPFQGVLKANEYLRYAAVFAMATSLNSLSSFVNSFKVTSRDNS
jgi:hypothetical protein